MPIFQTDKEAQVLQDTNELSVTSPNNLEPPKDSRVETIIVMGGEIIEKVYLAENGTRILKRGNFQ